MIQKLSDFGQNLVNENWFLLAVYSWSKHFSNKNNYAAAGCCLDVMKKFATDKKWKLLCYLAENQQIAENQRKVEPISNEKIEALIDGPLLGVENFARFCRLKLKINPEKSSQNNETELLVWLHVLWLLIELDFPRVACEIGNAVLSSDFTSSADLRARFKQAVVVAELATFTSSELTQKQRCRLGELIDQLGSGLHSKCYIN